MRPEATSFGLTLPQRGVFFGLTTISELLDLATAADQSGDFSSVWVGDSLLAKPRPDSIGLLGAIAGRTERVTLGVGCMASFPIRDPVVLAYQWATLDFISNGRMLMAACTGVVAEGRGSNSEGAHWGASDKERPARLEENIVLMRRLWTESNVTFSGRFHSYEDVTIEPRPVQSPCPIWIAANPDPESRVFERSLARVAELADGWMTVQVVPGQLRSSWQLLSRLLADRDRDPETFRRMAYHNFNVGLDREKSLEESQRFLDEYYGPAFTPGMTASWTAAGTPAECAQSINNLLDEGVTDVTLRATAWDQRGQYKRLVEEVLPLVHEHAYSTGG